MVFLFYFSDVRLQSSNDQIEYLNDFLNERILMNGNRLHFQFCNQWSRTVMEKRMRAQLNFISRLTFANCNHSNFNWIPFIIHSSTFALFPLLFRLIWLVYKEKNICECSCFSSDAVISKRLGFPTILKTTLPNKQKIDQLNSIHVLTKKKKKIK